MSGQIRVGEIQKDQKDELYWLYWLVTTEKTESILSTKQGYQVSQNTSWVEREIDFFRKY